MPTVSAEVWVTTHPLGPISPDTNHKSPELRALALIKLECRAQKRGITVHVKGLIMPNVSQKSTEVLKALKYSLV